MLRRFTLLSAASLLVFGSVRAEELPTNPPATPSFAPVKTKAMRPLVGDDVTYDWDDCTAGSTFSNGWTQVSVTGDQTWACTTFGYDPQNPTATTAYGHAVQCNGFNKQNFANEDWLISPSYDLTAYGKPVFGYLSRAKFVGDKLKLKVSTDSNGTPASGTWTDVPGAVFAEGPVDVTMTSDWKDASNIDLSAYKSGKVYLAFVYTSTTSSGTRYTLDNMSLTDAGTLATHTGSKAVIGLYPNPATSTVRFDVPELGSVQLEAFTADGRLVLKANGTVAQLNQALNQQMGSLASGIYMLRVTGTQQVYTSRLVKK